MKNALRLFLLAILLLACNIAAPTSTPMPACTPPPCTADEVYYCPDNCPGGCGTECATPTPSVEIPPESLTLYDGCAFNVSYPPELPADGSGWFVFFAATSAEEVYLSIQAYQETGATAEKAADALLSELAGHDDSPDYHAVAITDWNGETLTGVQADLISGGEHIRLLVVVRPETLLGNLAPDDVVYELVARSPVAKWSQWEPLFEVIFRSFRPRDCGGV